jgi:glycine oxidase
MAEHPDVLILGGGVIGLTTAYFLTRAGVRVAIADKGEFGQESSWAGAGIIAPAPSLAHASHPLDQLAAHSNRLHPQLAEELRQAGGVDNGYLACGGWELFDPEEQPPVSLWREQEIHFEEAGEQLLRDREPALQPRGLRAFFFPSMAQVRNPRHIKALLAWCGRAGVSLLPGCPILGFDRAGERITAVRSACGPLSAARYLVAAGAWSETLLQEVGFRPGIRPVRGQIALLNTATPLLTHIVEAGKRYLVPRPDGRVLVGSTEEDAGFVKRTTTAAIAGLLQFALALVPELANAPLERCWAGLRPGSPDGLPFLGGVPGVDNLFVAAGHYRTGIQLSPATGLVMKELLLGERTTVPLDAFRLDRQAASGVPISGATR